MPGMIPPPAGRNSDSCRHVLPLAQGLRLSGNLLQDLLASLLRSLAPQRVAERRRWRRLPIEGAGRRGHRSISRQVWRSAKRHYASASKCACIVEPSEPISKPTRRRRGMVGVFSAGGDIGAAFLRFFCWRQI